MKDILQKTFPMDMGTLSHHKEKLYNKIQNKPDFISD